MYGIVNWISQSLCHVLVNYFCMFLDFSTEFEYGIVAVCISIFSFSADRYSSVAYGAAEEISSFLIGLVHGVL